MNNGKSIFLLLAIASLLLAGCATLKTTTQKTGTPTSDIAGQVQGINAPSASDLAVPSLSENTGFENQSVSLP